MEKSTGIVLVSGSAESDANIRYLSGFYAPDPFLLLKTQQTCTLVVSGMEKGRAEKEVKKGVQVCTPEEIGLSGKGKGDLIEQILAWVNNANIKNICVPFDFPSGLFSDLAERGLTPSIIKTSICPDRKIKTKTEYAALRKSQQAAVAAMKRAIDQVQQSQINKDGSLQKKGQLVTSERVRKWILQELMEHGCTGEGIIVAGGEQATDPHEQGSGPLFAGEAIVIDIFPRNEKTGYWGDLTRTICRGPASKKLKNLYRAVKAAQKSALETVAPGIPASEVHQAAAAVFEARGYKTEKRQGRHVGFIHGTGHGVGLEIHEFPRVNSRSKEKLVPGHVITVEPGLYYPGIGGIRIEDTVVVTEKGWRYLASCPKKFEWGQ